MAKESCTAVASREEHLFHDDDYTQWTLVKAVILGILIGMGLMAYCFWRCGCRRKPQMVTESVQAPVRYTWYTASPRFVPLPEREHGSWRG